jgi:hypothetical protein
LRVTLALLVAMVLVSFGASAFAQGLGTSIWEKPGGETTPAASWLGSTGVVLIPSAQVGPVHSAQAYGHWVNVNNVVGGEEKDVEVWGADVMLTGNLEVGAVRFQNVLVAGTDSGSGRFTNETLLNAKYQLDIGQWTSNSQAPIVAVGVRDLTNALDRVYYVAATKDMRLRETEGLSEFTATLGFGSSNSGDGIMDGFFAGVELTPAASFRIQAEYDADNFNACLRFYPTSTVSIDVGSLDGSLGIGATYRTGY